MAQININIRMDEGLKKEFEWLCTEFGLNMTTAFNVFAKAVVRGRRIPFEIAVDEAHIPNDETLEAIEEVRRMKKDPSLGKAYTDVEQMMKELLS